MNLVKYVLCDIEIVMVDIEGTLYCSTPQLERVFRCNRSQLLHIHSKWRSGEFGNATIGELVLSNQHHKEIDGLHQALLLKRLQPKTRLWSEDDVLGFAFALRSDVAQQCRAQFKEILKQHARKEMIPRSQIDKMILERTKDREEIRMLWEAIEELKSANNKPATDRTLKLVKG